MAGYGRRTRHFGFGQGDHRGNGPGACDGRPGSSGRQFLRARLGSGIA